MKRAIKGQVAKRSRGSAARDHGIRPHVVDPYKRLKYTSTDGNLENFVHNWKSYKDHLTIFLGAGASVGAKNRQGAYIPTAAALRDELWRRFMAAPREKPQLGTMTLEHAAALIETKVGSKTLRDYAMSRFECQLPLWYHAAVPLLKPKAVFTTNYDNLVELGWNAQVARSSAPSLTLCFDSAKAIAPGHIPLFKPHGTVEYGRKDVLQGGLVLTAFDYFSVIGSYQEMLRRFIEDFSDTCVIFVGYSFMDMDIGAELFRMRQKDRGVHWYAVFPRDDADVRAMYQDKFGIRQINRTFFDFLTDLDDRVDFLPPDFKPKNIAHLKRTKIIQ